MRRGFFVALGVVAVVNLGALIDVARNRSCEADAALLLDERELELLPADRDSSALQVTLRYQNAPFSDDLRVMAIEDALAPSFLDEARLRAVGFDCSKPATSEGAAAFYRSALPRAGYVVFELGGPEWERRITAWQERESRRVEEQIVSGELSGDTVERARAEVAAAPRRMSRLMPIDAGRDPAALRQAHPDRARVLILPAVFRLDFVESPERGGPAIHGHLAEVFPGILAVPREARAPFEAVRAAASEAPRRDPVRGARGWGLRMADQDPRYEARVSTGSRLQPWIEQARLLR